ncbi:hypothetical protein PQX77_013726 [Marasmius sp. AFHP31]|nr:hypothetical protein PQX77_013726 [Marasmius sp. AFHP31]
MFRKDEEKYEKETDRVQWFRAKAERERWQEMLEKLEADFRNCIRHFGKMRDTWEMLGSESATLDKHSLFGHCAFARRQGAMYNKLDTTAQTTFTNLGFEDLPPGEILADRVAHDRARTSAKDQAHIERLVNEVQAEQCHIKDIIEVGSSLALKEVESEEESDNELSSKDEENGDGVSEASEASGGERAITQLPVRGGASRRGRGRGQSQGRQGRGAGSGQAVKPVRGRGRGRGKHP